MQSPLSIVGRVEVNLAFFLGAASYCMRIYYYFFLEVPNHDGWKFKLSWVLSHVPSGKLT